MADSYKIKLGVELDIGDIQSQISDASKNVKPIQIKVDTEAKELTKSINDALKTLSNGTKNALTLDTTKLETSLNDVASTIKEIKTSLSGLDSGAGMKSLLSSINQISTALDKASGKFDELNAELKTLSSKDFSINLGVNMGGSNPIGRNTAYGNKVRNETLPQLKQQMSDLVKYYNSTYKSSLNEFEALQKMVSGTKLSNGDFFENFLFGKDSVASRMNSGSLASQMQAYKQYIDLFKQAASLKGLDISGVTSGFSKSADDLIKDAQDIQTGANEMQEGFEKLKQVFGGNNLNVEGLSTQLDSIVADLSEIKTALQGLSSGTSLDGLTQSFNKLSETLDKVIANAGNFKNAMTGATSGSSGASGIAQDVEKVGVAADKAENEVNGLKNALKGMGVNSDTATISQEIENLGIKVQKVTKTLNGDKGFSIKVTGVKELNDGLEQSITLVQRFNSKGIAEGSTQTFTDNIKKADDALLKLQNDADKLITSSFASNMKQQFDGVESSFNGLSQKTDEVKGHFDDLKNKYGELKSAMLNYASVMSDSTADEQQKKNAMEQLIAANEEYQNTLATTKNLIADNAKAEKDAANAEILTNKKNALMSEMNTYLQQNTKAAAKYGDEIRNLQSVLSGVTNNNDYRVLTSQWDALKKKIRETGDEGKTFGQTFKDAFASISQYLSAAAIFNYASRALRDMFEQVKAIDTAMTELKKVTDETDASYNQFLTNAASRAKELGTTIDGLVTSTADFARLGYGFEDAQGLAEVANIYAVVGDEIASVEDASQSLISTMAAFKDEMGSLSDSDFALSIVDKFNEVSNNFSISSGGIGEALTRSASSLAAANNTLDESIALITAANTVVSLCHAA